MADKKADNRDQQCEDKDCQNALPDRLLTLVNRRIFDMQATVHESKQSIMQRILTVFVFTLLIATVGLFIGQFVPVALMLPLSILEVAMIILAFWMRRRKAVGYAFVYTFAFVSGITSKCVA